MCDDTPHNVLCYIAKHRGLILTFSNIYLTITINTSSLLICISHTHIPIILTHLFMTLTNIPSCWQLPAHNNYQFPLNLYSYTQIKTGIANYHYNHMLRDVANFNSRRSSSNFFLVKLIIIYMIILLCYFSEPLSKILYYIKTKIKFVYLKLHMSM